MDDQNTMDPEVKEEGTEETPATDGMPMGDTAADTTAPVEGEETPAVDQQ